MNSQMANQTGHSNFPLEQEKLDVDRLVNEGGPAPVSPKEVAKRDEVWVKTLEKEGEAAHVKISLDHDTEQRFRQMARERGVTFENLMSMVLHKFSHDELVERSH